MISTDRLTDRSAANRARAGEVTTAIATVLMGGGNEMKGRCLRVRADGKERRSAGEISRKFRGRKKDASLCQGGDGGLSREVERRLTPPLLYLRRYAG